MENKDLNSNKTDLLVAAAKSVVGIVPIAGSLLSEIVGNIIPNQRIDRLSKYINMLDSKLSTIPNERVSILLSNEEFVDFIEEGFVQASRATSDERREYISSLVKNGIIDDKIKFEESKMLLKILQELSDVEIIWLRSYLFPSMESDKTFRKTHKNILDPVIDVLGGDDETKAKAAFQKSYQEHLIRIQLIAHRYKVNSTTGSAEFEKVSGKQKIISTYITTLGRLLLKQIGLINELNPR